MSSIDEPNEEIYKAAAEALWDWTAKQTDHNDVWEKTDESSKIVVDTIWPMIMNRTIVEYQVWYSDSMERISKRKTFRTLPEAQEFASNYKTYTIDSVIRTSLLASYEKLSETDDGSNI